VATRALISSNAHKMLSSNFPLVPLLVCNVGALDE
jgi:hypothetical protein